MFGRKIRKEVLAVESRLNARLDGLFHLLRALEAQGVKMSGTLDQVLQDVTDEKTLIDGVGTLITGLKQQLADALANAGLSPADQAKVDAIFAQAETNKAALAAALAANTPAAPAPGNPA